LRLYLAPSTRLNQEATVLRPPLLGRLLSRSLVIFGGCGKGEAVAAAGVAISVDSGGSAATQLWDSLDDHQVQLTPAQQAGLERCFTMLDHDRTQSVTWETLKAELEQRCP
jgi:putative addiction module component (TIGR02574 family)